MQGMNKFCSCLYDGGWRTQLNLSPNEPREPQGLRLLCKWRTTCVSGVTSCPSKFPGWKIPYTYLALISPPVNQEALLVQQVTGNWSNQNPKASFYGNSSPSRCSEIKPKRSWSHRPGCLGLILVSTGRWEEGEGDLCRGAGALFWSQLAPLPRGDGNWQCVIWGRPH